MKQILIKIWIWSGCEFEEMRVMYIGIIVGVILAIISYHPNPHFIVK